MAAKQLQVIFETLLPSRVTYRPPKKIGRALSDREIQPFDERRVQFRGVLGAAQPLFQSPRGAGHCSSLDLDNAIVRTRLDDLAVETGWPKEATDNFSVRVESVTDYFRRPRHNYELAMHNVRLEEFDADPRRDFSRPPSSPRSRRSLAPLSRSTAAHRASAARSSSDR